MKSVLNRLGCLLLVLVLLVTCVPQLAIPAKAAYENTHVNTGDQRADLIGVALTQVGYREGYNNYTKYGVWFGSSNMAWCGAFVSWCANQAGIPSSVLRKNGFASASGFGIPSFTVYDRIPRPGDLFFKNSGGHTGIVYYVEGNYFYTLEGNTYEAPTYEDGVYIRKRNLYGEYYFGSPNYQSDVGHNYQKGVETAHPHKEYYKCTDCGSQYYTGRYGEVEGCTTCLMENCQHSYGNYTRVDDTYHSAKCTICTKENTQKHNWTDSAVLKAATCQSAGLKQQRCSQCTAVREVQIPKTDDHQYDQWEYVDETHHTGTCQTCGYEAEKEHKVDTWQTSNLDHWYTCSDCGGRSQIGAHNFPNGCEDACSVCGYENTAGHSFATVLSSDADGHWYACLSCSEEKDRHVHEYAAQCAEICEVCGYTRQTEHIFGEEWTADATGHWHACVECGKVEALIPHVPGQEATEQQAQRCTECDYEMIPAKRHIHDYAPYESDGKCHWGSCVCGEKLEPQSHVWSLSDGKCQVCGVETQVTVKEPFPWMTVLPIVGGGALVLAAGLGTFLAIRKKKKTAQPV